MATFPHLFSPLKLRSTEIRNRILSTGHQTNLAEGAAPGNKLIGYHEARAKGGAGLIVVESARFHSTALSDVAVELNIGEDRSIDGYRRLANAVHRHGAKIFGQLSHAGRVSRRIKGGLRDVAFAPSAIPDNRFHTMPRAMPLEMIEEIVQSCGTAAKRLADAGLDGVELVSSHGLLFAQFLSPRTNIRDDRYGGSVENRMRFLTECLAAVRSNVGNDLVVGIRISAEEIESDGLEAPEVIDICKRLAALGAIDYVNTTIGSMAGPGGSIHVVPPMEIQPGYVAAKAGSIRAQVGLPVFVAGRINQPQTAEEILAAGQADMCAMTRAMITDPEMPNKAREGRVDDIRACIGCNQACIGHFHAGYGISCIQNPVSGREYSLGESPVPQRRRSVLVVGAGPAGMKAAVTAAERGHHVTLCEAGARLGGQALLAQALPMREEFGGLITNLQQELAATGVGIRLNTKVTRAFVDAGKFDAIVVATGAVPYEPPIEGREEGHVINGWDVLNGKAKAGSRVLVADWRCDWVGMGVAEKLARDGHQVRIAVNGMHLGYNLQLYLRDSWVARLHELGLEVITQARIFGVDANTAYLVHAVSGAPIVCEEVDTVVLCTGHESVTELEQELAGWSGEVVLAGDCLSPRTAEEAVYEGLLAGRRL